jgi:iron-sulfur cluster assembly accessory protein
MFEITPNAAEQIFKSAKQSNTQGLALRIDVRETPDQGFEYLMGFDEIHPSDVHVVTAGIDIVFADKCKALLNGAKMDFVEIEGQMNFIFLNPNDPTYVEPKES